jgi:hypothetical protein
MPLEEAVLQEIHMLQHQLGAATRADLQRLNELLDENAVLSRELGAAQQRCTRQADEHARTVAQLQADVVKLRAELIGRDTALAAVSEELRALERSVPGLRSRAELGRLVERQITRIHDLERALLRVQQEVERERARAELAERTLAEHAQPAAQGRDVPPEMPRLDDRAVLCVGGRQAIVPVYRKLIERVGGRFLHHDGGDEDGPTQLDATLASADLVICQTGCISHDAYWRVKDHCKRTGKRCVFVDKPSRAGLQRALSAMLPSEAPPATALTDGVAQGE